MSSNAQKGAYYKGRTRRYLDARQWLVADLEVVHYVWTPKGRLPIKRDQWGADLMACRGEVTWLIQVKGGKQAVGGGTFPSARRVFALYALPSYLSRVIFAWAPGARAPRIIGMDGSEQEE